MILNNIDISVIITAHNEGRLAHLAMRSLFRAVDYANCRGLYTEIIVVLDNPDKATVEYFTQNKSSDTRVETVGFGDLALSRNYGVSLSKGNHIAILDADNLYSEKWLFNAFCYLEKSSADVIAHPQYHVIFDMDNYIWRQISSCDAEFDPLCLLESNYWDSVCFATREIFLGNPYTITTSGNGFGYEDWHFNCETLAKGIEHHVVPETTHFYRRRRSGSLSHKSRSDMRVLRASKLFQPDIMSTFMQRKKIQCNRSYHPVVSQSILSRLKKRIHIQRRRFRKPVELMLIILSRLNPKLNQAVEGFVESLKRLIVPTEPIPQWLVDEWRAINTIEPLLFPERRLISNISCYAVPEPRIGKYYLDLCQLYGEKISHVFLVPWLKKGGADLAAINYIEALAVNRLVTGITVIACQKSDSPWVDRLPSSVNFIAFGGLCKGLSSEEQETLLTRLLLQMTPSVVHNINSDLGYRVFIKYGRALSSVSGLYASSYCDDINQEGKIVGYPSKYLNECIDLLQGVLCDCNFFAEKLHERYAFDKRKLFVHYQPCNVSEMRRCSVSLYEKGSINVLWASRLDRQKRPDILMKIAAACRDLPITFNVYGTSLLCADIYSSDLRRLPNVKSYGAFDGLHSLPVDKYDVLLYTSQWDGLPNILLEALSMGLPVIAPDVCGIGELIVNNETGVLIEKFDDVDAYVECLKGILKDSSNFCNLVSKAQVILNDRHSWVNFNKQLKDLPGYLQ